MDREPDNQFHPVINVEETIGKTVGRRRPKTPFGGSPGREAVVRYRESFGGVRIPRGVYRFTSHEEADKWMIRKIAEAAARS